MAESSQRPHEGQDPFANDQWRRSWLFPIHFTRRPLRRMDLALLGFAAGASLPILQAAISPGESMNLLSLTLIVAAGLLVTGLLLILAAQPACQYGLSFPMLLVQPFGIYGARIVSLVRAVFGMLFFGAINLLTAETIVVALKVLASGLGRLDLQFATLKLRISPLTLLLFVAITMLHAGVASRGPLVQRRLVLYLVPIGAVAAMMWAGWLIWKAPDPGTFGSWLSLAAFREPHSSHHFLTSVSLLVTMLIPLTVSSPDLFRLARRPTSSGLSLLGGLAAGALFFMLVAATGATVHAQLRGTPAWDPLAWTSGLFHPATVWLLVIWQVASLAAFNQVVNVHPSTQATAMVWPRGFTYRNAAWLVGLLSLVGGPLVWMIRHSQHWYASVWAIAVALLTALVIMLVNFALLRRGTLVVEDLYRPPRSDLDGWRGAALLAWLLAYGAVIWVLGRSMVEASIQEQLFTMGSWAWTPLYGVVAYLLLVGITTTVLALKARRNAAMSQPEGRPLRQARSRQSRQLEKAKTDPRQRPTDNRAAAVQETLQKQKQKKQKKKLELDKESDAVKSWLK